MMKKVFFMFFIFLLSSVNYLSSANYDLDEIPVESLDSFYDDQVSTSDAAVLPSEEEEEIPRDSDYLMSIEEDLAPESVEVEE